MKLLTKEVCKRLPALRSTEDVPLDDKIAVVKFFFPWGRATFYATEGDPNTGEFFGYVVSPLGPDCDEWGYFYLPELIEIRGPGGLSLERDMHFKPTKVSELI